MGFVRVGVGVPARTETGHCVLGSGRVFGLGGWRGGVPIFPSFESNDSGVPTGEQDETLIEDGFDDIAGDRNWDLHRGRHAQPDDDDVAEEPTELTEVSGDPVEAPTGTAVVHTADEWDGPDDFRFIVRPYTWTQGRTRPVQELAVETLVSTSDVGRDVATTRSAEHSAIAGLCVDVRSVAEVAALLAVPLGVARVLLADMIDTGLVHVHRNPTEAGRPPDLSLMERVLGGLQQL
ncbi:MAG: DUF742 domain-containing protein [Actinomycetota bacterium]|nr:DUF742 domain-containing protein [Actinomycetota bacterium]